MRQRIRSKLTYANVMATIAVFLVLSGGTAVALNGSNTVQSDDLGPGAQVKAADVADNAVNGADVVNDSLGGADVKESALTKVPNADTLDGINSTGFLQVASGRTIRGAFEINQDGGTGSGPLGETAVGFPIRAHLTKANQVNFAPTPGFPGLATDTDPACTGTEDNPTAPRGKVCLYIGQPNNVTDGQGFPGGVSSAFLYFLIDVHRSSGTGAFSLYGTWAYTVP